MSKKTQHIRIGMEKHDKRETSTSAQVPMIVRLFNVEPWEEETVNSTKLPLGSIIEGVV